MTTGLTVGVAPGAAVAGAAVDAWGAAGGFWVPVGGGVLAAASAWMISESPARPVGPAGAAGETVDMSSAPLGADSGRRPDA